MAIYYVHNLQEHHRLGNWLEFWKNATGIKTPLCHSLFCSEVATDGAHVQLDDPNNHNWYVVPLCHKHNCQFGAHFYVCGPLVPVNPMNEILP